MCADADRHRADAHDDHCGADGRAHQGPRRRVSGGEACVVVKDEARDHRWAGLAVERLR